MADVNTGGSTDPARDADHDQGDRKLFPVTAD
jgi:hypothetical protein